ncbi:MAG: hypothetical protein QNJ12_21805 [Ilumatobacter sp.]|uniref:hypothetical protein n=1 Tax=Ilumatobacter sp. TaxID=1967498 RepID=UPI0026216789|nr:hypothetical protein [Ilumatobacter sp.]MDJ0771437.1 hypothetical protein [Ilumatobacter sp.]
MNPTIHVVGRGIVARRLHRLLHAHRVIVQDPWWSNVTGTAAGDVVVLAQGGLHAPAVPDLLDRGLHVVTVGDELDDIRELLELDHVAAASGLTLMVGAAMSPGLSGLLARQLAGQLACVDEIHVAFHGTAGPACARAHHRSLSGRSIGWYDGAWAEYVGGSGRELCWFPEPVGAMDCYRAQIASPLVLQRAFPGVGRISARRSATRRDRFTAFLPMLRPPHVEGGIGALRVELRGGDDAGGRQCVIAGVAELVGTAAAATAAAFTTAIVDGLLPAGAVVAAEAALPTTELLRRVQSFGTRLQEFTGVPQPS